MCQKIKTLLNWQMAFTMLGFSGNTCVCNTCRSQFLGYNSGSRKQCKPIRITVQYNRVQLLLFSIVDITGIYTYDTSCSKSLYQVVRV